MTTKNLFALAILLASARCMAQSDIYGNSEASIHWYELQPTAAPTQNNISNTAFAAVETVSHSPSSAGSREILADGNMLWTVGYRSEGAVSMSVVLRDIDLPQGGAICVMDETGTECRLTVSDKDGRQKFIGSPRVMGNKIIVQYVGPATDTLHFTVHNVCKGFVDIDKGGWNSNPFLSTLKADYNPLCMVNAACRPDLSDQRRGVGLILTNNSKMGTVSLINNTLCNHEPLLLTAAHVVDTPLMTLSYVFNFEAPSCDATTEYLAPVSMKFSTEATVVYLDRKADMAILRLPEAPTYYTRPYWFGWSRELSTSGKVVSLHHSNSTPMKLSEASDITPLSSFKEYIDAIGDTYAKSFWLIRRWDNGNTYQGSSGCPLLNSNKEIIGALSAGISVENCSDTTDNLFSMIGMMWDRPVFGYPTLKEILDPADTNPQSLGDLEVSEEPFNKMKEEITFADEKDVFYFSLRKEEPTVRQHIGTSEHPRTIYGVRVYRDMDVYTKDRPIVDVKIQTSDGIAHYNSEYAYPIVENVNVYDIFFSTPVAIAAGKGFDVILESNNLEEGDLANILALSVKGGYDAERYKNSEWTVIKEDVKLMLKVYYSEDESTAYRMPQQKSSLSFRLTDATLRISGAPISATAIYDYGGHLVNLHSAEGRPEQHIDLCGLPSGLYVVRSVALNGDGKSMRIVVK